MDDVLDLVLCCVKVMLLEADNIRLNFLMDFADFVKLAAVLVES
jgi:hypothetical protein